MKQFHAVVFDVCSAKNFLRQKKSASFWKTMSLILAFVILAGFGNLHAQLLVTEDFSYTASSALVVTNGYTANTGTGTNNLTIAASGSGLSYSGSPRSAVGLALPMANTGEDAYKSYTSQTSGAVYASALINLSVVGTGDYFFALMTGATYNARLYAKSSGAGYVLGVGKSSATASYDATVNALNTTVLVIIKYQFNSGTTTDDAVSLFINPTLGGTEPAALVSTVGAPTTDAASISSYGFRQGGGATTAPTLIIDGIMVGTTWASVTPSSVSPTITPSPTTLTGFTYAVGSGPSTSQSFTLAASNLTAGGGTITITGSTNYEVSTTTSTTGFGATATLTYTGTGTLSPNTVWVRLKSGLSAANYNSQTIAISGGTGSSSVTVSGSVTSPTITPSPATLTGFNYIVGAGPSTSQSFTLSASSLTAGGGTITINGSTDYEVSTTTSTTGFGASATLTYTGTGTISPNTVWVRLKAGLATASYNAETIGISGGGGSSSVTVSGSVSAAATLTPSPTTLTGFNYTLGSGPSASQSFTLSAANLTAGGGTITITGSTDYEVSTTTSTTGFGASATLSYTGTGTISPNTAWVRLKTGLASANYNLETISISGGGGSSSVTVSGNVTTPIITPSPITLSGFNYTAGSGPSTSQSFTLSASGLAAGGGTITISGSTNYDVSTTTSTTGFGASATLTYTGAGTLSPNTVWVRLKAGLSANTYNGETISVSGGGGSTSVTANGSVYSGTFSNGFLSVETIGDGVATLSGTANYISIREYNSTGTQTNAFTLPGATTSLPSSAPWYMVESGSATSAGQMNRSTDGSQLIFPGYNALVGTTTLTLTTTPTNKRVMGIVYPNGTNSTYANDFFSASGATTGIFRSIASNGYSYWAVGTSPVSAGLFYLKNASSTPVSLGSINTRVARIFNNILYYSTATTSNAGIFQVSTNGLPLSVSDVAIVRLTDATYANTVTNGSSPYAFEINPAGNIMYIADDATFVSSSTQKGGVIKYTKSGSTWTYQYTLPSPANSARGLAVDWSTTNPTLYFTTTASSNNAIAKLIDVNSSSTGTIITAGAGANYVFRGIQFSPVAIAGAQLTCTANLLPFGGQPIGIPSQEKAFNVAGTGFTGNITVSIPVTSPTDQYGLSLTPGGPYTSSVTITGGSPANATVYMVLNPNTVGTFNGNLTISATGASNVLVPVTGKGIIPVNYYNVAGTDVTRLVNWGTNTNGTGTNPPDFTSDGQYFNINNAPLVLASSATTAVIDQLATTASGNAVLTFTGVPTCNNSPQSLFVGATITGTGIPGGTTILSITANTITMSANATITDNIGTTISVAVTGPWTITGSLSKIVVGNGINFIIPSTRAFAGTADVAAGGTLTLQNNTLPTLGILDVASTVNYNQAGAATVVTATYGNLTLQGSALQSRTLPSSSSIALDLKVLGSFVANNVTVSAATVSPFTYMELGKDFTMSNGAVMLAATPTTSLGLLYIVTTGNSNQTFSYMGGGTIRINSLSSTKSAGILTLGTNTTLLAYISPGVGLTYSGSASFVSQSGTNLNTTGSASLNLAFTGSSTFTLGGNLKTSDNSSLSLATPINPTGSLITNFASGTSFNDGGNNITIAGNLGMGGVAGSYTLTGTQTIATQTGASTIGDNALNATIIPTLKNFTFAPVGGTGTTFAGSNGTVNIAGNFLISSAGTATTNAISGGSNTINIAGNYTDQRTIDMVSAGTATWTFNGSSAQTFSTAYTSGESFYSAELANAAGLTMTSGNMNIGASGNLTCTSGILTTGSNKVLLDATAFVVESTSSYILGNVQTTRTLNTFAEAFGGIGLSITAGTAPGLTTVLRNTGTSNAIGCVNKSVKRTFTITNSGTSLNANVAYTFVPVNELNGLTQADLDLYDVTGNTPFANSTISANTITKTGLSTIGGTYSASITAPTITASATADAVCFSASAHTTDLAYTASTGDITTYSITWSGTAPGQGFTNVSNAALVASPITITIPAGAVANTYSGSLTVKNSSGCTSVSSPFTLTINPLLPPSVVLSVKTGNNPTCDGGSVVMKATPTNGGTLPSYQWFKNGSPVPGNSTDTLLVSGISSTTTVYAVLTVGTGICVTTPTATSATTTINTVANSWTGVFSNNWFDKKNWCANAVPNAGTDIFIPVTSRNPVIAGSVNANADNINIATGAALTITNVTLVVSRTVTGTGTISGTGGLTLAYSGSVGTLYFGAAGIKTLKMTGTGASATLGNATSIYGELNIGSATLTTGGNLTLKSDINGTANVAPITGSGNITGNVTVERYIPQNAFRAWRMLSVPVQGGGTQSTFKTAWQENQAPMANGNPGYGVLLTTIGGGNGYDAATSGNSLLSFNSGNPGTFSAVSSTTNAMATNAGYFVYIRGNRSSSLTAGAFNPSATTLRINGPLYVGTRPTITLPAGTNVMVGNQYASAIDFDLMTKSGVTGFSVWDPKIAGTYNVGGYNTYSTFTGWSINGGSYVGATAGRIESGQAFIVNSTSGGSITLTEAAKVTGSRNVFKTNPSLQVLRTKLYATTTNGSKLADGNAIVFGDAFSNGTDEADMIKPTNIGENLGIKNGSILSVEGRSKVTTEDIINYAISNLKQQQYSLEFTPENMDASLTAYLEDKFANTSTPVSMTTATTVKFTITSNAASAAADRFRIVFKAAPQAAATTVAAKVVSSNSKNTVEVSWKNAAEKGIQNYEVDHSADGITFSKIATATAKGNNGAAATYTTTDEAAQNGSNYYRIKVVSANGSVAYSNVVKVEITKAVEITVYPNPVMDGNMNVHFANAARGSYTASVMNKSGQAVLVQTLSISNGSSVKTMRLPTATPAGSYQLKVQQTDGKTITQTIIVGDK